MAELLHVASRVFFSQPNIRHLACHWRGYARVMQKKIHSNSAHNVDIHKTKRNQFYSWLFDFLYPVFLFKKKIEAFSTLLCERGSTMETRTKDKGKEKQSSWVEHARWGLCALPMSRMWRHWFICEKYGEAFAV